MLMLPRQLRTGRWQALDSISSEAKTITAFPSDTHLIPEAPRLTGYDQHIMRGARNGLQPCMDRICLKHFVAGFSEENSEQGEAHAYGTGRPLHAFLAGAFV